MANIQRTCGQCTHYKVKPIYIQAHYERDGVSYNQKVPNSKWVESYFKERILEETDEGICTVVVPQWVCFNTPFPQREIRSTTRAVNCKLFWLAENPYRRR